MEETTNTVAEATAMLKASKHCKHSSYDKVILQTDSLLLQKVLTGEWSCPWSITDIIAEITINMQGKQTVIQHIYREGNKLADYLANHAING